MLRSNPREAGNARKLGLAWVIASALTLMTACTVILGKDGLSGEAPPDAGGLPEAGTDAEAGNSCSATRVDCDGDDANGCETDLSTDPSNCGACGHGCLDGACDAGKCKPFTLATGQDTPSVLTTDETHVYWTNQGGAGAVMRVAKAGGEPDVVGVTDQPPGGLAVDEKTVFWSELGPAGSDNSVWRLDKADIGESVSPALLQGGQSPSIAVAVDETNVYWVTPGTVRTKKKTGGPTTTLAPDQDLPFGLVVDLGFLYWTTANGGTVMALDLSDVDAGPYELATGQGYPTGLATDFVNLYWVNLQGDADGGTPNVVRLAKVNMDEPEVLADGQQGPTVIKANGSELFWSNNVGGTVMRMPKTGGTPEVLAEGQGAPAGLDVDADAVYWANRDGGQVMAVAR